MIKRLQALPQTQRTWAFFGLMLLFIVAFIALGVLVLILIARSSPRLTPFALTNDVRVREFSILSDAQAYPASLTLAPDGTLYTGSYVHGAIWRIAADGTAEELPNTRERIGSVTALKFAADGNLYVLDRLAPLYVLGAIVWRITPDGNLDDMLNLTGEWQDTLQLPDDFAFDGQGNLYISDRGQDAVWRWTAEQIEDEGAGAIWWRSPQLSDARAYAPTGLAYDAQNDALLITDSLVDILYSIPVNANDPILESRALFNRRQQANSQPLGLDGVSVDETGNIYIAALAINQIFRFTPEDSLWTPLAGNYRGASDVVYDGQNQRLYVANWDQRSLLPLPVLFFNVPLDPHLPFSIDLIELGTP